MKGKRGAGAGAKAKRKNWEGTKNTRLFQERKKRVAWRGGGVWVPMAHHKTWIQRGAAIDMLPIGLKQMVELYVKLPGIDKEDMFLPVKSVWR